MFCGAGGKKGEKGIGILLHNKLVKFFKTFHAVSNRLGAVDVDIGSCWLRFIAVYMPHGGCDDEQVEGIHAQLTDLVSRASLGNRRCIVAGDWNAIVRSRQVGNDENILGQYGVGSRNVRGEWLIHWASTHGLAIVNTMIEKSFDKQWTYESGGIRRQLDYCLTNSDWTKRVMDAAACEDIGVGIDHRTVKVAIKIHLGHGVRKCRTRKKKKHKKRVGRTFEFEVKTHSKTPSRDTQNLVQAIPYQQSEQALK